MKLARLAGLAAVCGMACGSADSSRLTASGGGGEPKSPSTGGQRFGAGGDATATGGLPGGASSSSGGASSLGGSAGAGGFAQTGGLTGAGGGLSAGGFSASGGVSASGGTPSSGGASDAGSDAGGPSTGGSAGLPTGGLVTPECSTCASSLCPEQTDACLADPACVSVMQCLSTCLFLQCAGCVFGGVPSTLQNFSDCTNANCPICPNFSSFGGR